MTNKLNLRKQNFIRFSKRYLDDGTGRHARLKILFAVTRVWVRFPSEVRCNDSEMNNGTDAKYEMETNETRIKEWIRYKPYRHYINWGVSSVG